MNLLLQYTHMHTKTCKYAHIHAHTCVHTRTHTHAWRRAHRHAHRCAHTGMRTWTHGHRHGHGHTQIHSSLWLSTFRIYDTQYIAMYHVYHVMEDLLLLNLFQTRRGLQVKDSIVKGWWWGGGGSVCYVMHRCSSISSISRAEKFSRWKYLHFTSISSFTLFKVLLRH